MRAPPSTSATGDGSTPLHFAAQWNYEHPAIIEALLDGGANVNAATNAGETALFRVVREGAGPVIIDTLWKAGATLDTGDRRDVERSATVTALLD